MLKLSSIDFIEDLQQDKDIEENGVVFSSLIIPIFHMDWRRNTKDLGAYIREKYYL